MTDVDTSVFVQASHEDGVFFPRRLSYSAISTYAECGEKFRLERLHKIPTGTWWATIAGKAVHYLTECYDHIQVLGQPFECEIQGGVIHSAESIATFRQAFDYFLEKEGHEGQEIKASGKKNQQNYTFLGGPSGRDREWWYLFGPAYVEAWLAWRDDVLERGWELLEIECSFEVQLGGFTVIGLIDRVFFDHETGQIIIVDLKTGAREPTDSLQLLTYREGLRRKLFIDAEVGHYVFFRWAKPPVVEQELVKPAGRRPGKAQLAKAQAALAKFEEADPPWRFTEEPHAEILERQAAFDAYDRELELQAAAVEPEDAGHVEAFLSRETLLSEYPAEFVDSVYSQAHTGIRAQVFPFNTTASCLNNCGVSEFCRAVGGRRAAEYPIWDTIKFREDDGVSQTENPGDASSVIPNTKP